MAELPVVQQKFSLTDAPPAVVFEFAKIAVSVIIKGEPGGRRYAKAAKQLHTTVEAIDQAVSNICIIYARSARANLSYQQIIDYLASQGFSETSRQTLAEYFVAQVGALREVVSVSILRVRTYQTLDWRLDLQVASRSLRHQAVPSFLLKLCTKPDRTSTPSQLINQDSQVAEKSEVFYLEVKYATLKAICTELEAALAEARSAHGHRVMRHFK